MLITSVKNPNVVLWAKLKKSKYQKEEQKFIIEEKLIIKEAKKAGLSMTVIALDGSGIEADYTVSDNVMRKLSFNTSLNEVIAIVDFYDHDSRLGEKIVYLDNLQDPGNVGTIIRTAYAFGYTDIVLNDGVSKYNHKLIAASKGAIFHVNIIEDKILKNLKDEGYSLVGTLLDESSERLENVILNNKFVLVFGNEGQGLSQSVIDILDHKVYLEMNNFDSLNVGITAGIVLYNYRG